MISNLRKAPKDPKDDPRRTPSKPSERIRGSDLNEPGSAGTKGGGVTLSAAQESWLRSQVEDHNKRVSAKSKQARMEPLRKVYRRGMGAFSSTHHPIMDRDGWGRARVMHHLHLLERGKPKNPRYVQDNDLLPKGHPQMKKNAGSMPPGFDSFGAEEVFGEQEPAPTAATRTAPLAGLERDDAIQVGRNQYVVVRSWGDYEAMVKKPNAKRKMFSVRQENDDEVAVREQKGTPDATLAGPVLSRHPLADVRRIGRVERVPVRRQGNYAEEERIVMKKNNPLGMAATERHPTPYDVEESGPMTVRSGGPFTVRSEEAPPPATVRSTPAPTAPRQMRLRCTVEEDMVPNRKPQVGDRVRRTTYGEVYARVDRPVTKAGYVPVVIEGRFPVNDRWPLKETEVVEMAPNRIGIQPGTHAMWDTGMADIPVVVEGVSTGMVQVRDSSGALHNVSPMDLALEHGREVTYAANHHLRAGQTAWLAYVGQCGGAIDKVKVLKSLPGDEYVVQIGSSGATERIDGSVLFADKEAAAAACERMESNPYVRFAVQADWGDSEEKKEMESNRQGAGPYWVWTLSVGSDRPLVGEGPHGPHDLAGAKTYARIAATKGKHDRAVSRGRDPQAKTFQVVRRYRAGDGERLI